MCGEAAAERARGASGAAETDGGVEMRRASGKRGVARGGREGGARARMERRGRARGERVWR